MVEYLNFNLSLNFLQSMTHEEARHFFGYKTTNNLNYSQVVANIIFAASKLHWDDTRGVHEFWYNPIKPIVLKLFPEVNTPNGDRKKEKLFNGILSDMVKKGLITYRSLGIVDFRTMRELYEAKDRTNCWSNIILFVEKDSAWIHLRPLKELLNITILSGGGWSNTANAEYVRDTLSNNREYKVFIVSDHDPYGFEIGKEAAYKLDLLGLNVKEYHRIAIKPEQIPEGIQEAQKYPVKMTLKSSPSWCAEHGLEGPRGKVYGLEIEAVSGQPGGPQRIREIVLETLLKHLDEDDRRHELTDSIWDKVPVDVFNYHLDEETLGCWAEIDVSTVSLSEYVEEWAYNEAASNLEYWKELETKPHYNSLREAEEQIEEMQTEHGVTIAENYNKYQERILELRRKYIEPVERERDEELKRRRAARDEELQPLIERRDEIESEIWDLEAPYDSALEGLEEKWKKSRALYAHAHWKWITENIQRYIDLAPETEPLSFGLLKGFLLEALKNGEAADDLIRRVFEWDRNRVYSYISNELESDEEVQGEIDEILQELIAGAQP